MGKIKKFLQMPLGVKLMLPEAMGLSAYYWYWINRKPFSELSPKIGTLWVETPIAAAPVAAKQVKGVVEAVSKRMPWKCTCLVRALTAKKMLNRRGKACTLYMGVKPGDDGKMEAHAWLRCGRQYVTGGNGAGYTVTTIYGDKEMGKKNDE